MGLGKEVMKNFLEKHIWFPLAPHHKLKHVQHLFESEEGQLSQIFLSSEYSPVDEI